MEQHFAIRLLLGASLMLGPSAAFAQCTGVFPPNTLCGNLSGSPAPPSAFAASSVVGPGSSTLNGLPLWANTLGTQLKDGAGQTITGNYTWGGTQTFSATANFTSVFQIGGVTVTLPVTVPNGGTGLATLTAHAPQIGNGTGTVTQGGVGAAGQPWISGGASADPSFQTGAVLQGAPTNPAGTSSASLVMMGLGVTTCRMTPVYSSRARAEISGNASSGSVATFTMLGKFGTGAGPANGVAATGSNFGLSVQQVLTTATAATAMVTSGIITGLTPGTTYWFDISFSTTAGTATISSVACQVMEF